MYQPGYAAWEQRFGVVGAARDADGDGWSNFAEYAFGGDPRIADELTPIQLEYAENGQLQFRLQGRLDEDDMEFTLFQAATLDGPWENVTPLIGTVAPAQTPAAEVTAIVLPWSEADGPRLYRASAMPTRSLLSITRVHKVGQAASGALTREDPQHPLFADRHTKIYRLEGLTTGSDWVLTGRSERFDVRLELIDGDTGAVLAVADHDLAVGTSGTDERIGIMGDSSRTFLLRVTSESGSGLGGFYLGGFDARRVYSTLPAISGAQSISGSLSVTDTMDPEWLPSIFYLDEYYLNVTGNHFINITLQSSAFDTFLEVVDAEYGMVLYSNDDTGSGTDSAIFMETMPGRTYILRVSSATEAATGSYMLTTAPGDPLPVLQVPGSINASLAASDREDPNYPGTYMDEYELRGLATGQWVTITMASQDLDAYLFLIDANSLKILDQNDDYADFTRNARITFQAEAGRSYRIRATSYDAGETGAYTLTAQ